MKATEKGNHRSASRLSKNQNTALLTIFTPSYNNGTSLKTLYQTLLKQTCKDFQWMIVDDGSDDATQDIVSIFQQNADFKIQYFYQKNQGKYKAQFYTIHKCHTKLFCCIDADIQLYEYTVEIMLNEWKYYQRNIIGIGLPIIYYKYNNLLKMVGGSFPKKTPEIGNLSELTSKWGYHGETLYMFLTDILKELTIPKIENEKFWTESAFYFPLNKKYKVHWLNIPAGESVYQSTGLSNNRLKNEVDSPNLTLLAYKRGAIYHPLFLHRIANCCLYISWKRTLKLKDNFAEHISMPVYFFAYLLEPAYSRTFRKNVKTYLKELG